MRLQKLVQIDLVGAADHRLRIVDDRHAFGPGALGETIGVAVDRGRRADEEAVKLGELGELLAGDELDRDRLLFGDPLEVLERVGRRGRQRLLRIVQNGERISGDRPAARIAPVALGVAMQALAEEFRFVRSELGERPGAEPIDLPPLACRDGDFDRRAPVPVEQEAPESLETGVLGKAEAEQEVEGRGLRRLRLEGRGGEGLLQFRQRLLVEFEFAQIEHRLDGRDHAMAARLGEQGGVIALGLVVVGARKIDDLRPSQPGEQFRPREIIARGDDLVRRVGVGEIARLVDENDPAGHDARRSGRTENRDNVFMMTGGMFPEVYARDSKMTGAIHPAPFRPTLRGRDAPRNVGTPSAGGLFPDSRQGASRGTSHSAERSPRPRNSGRVRRTGGSPKLS